MGKHPKLNQTIKPNSKDGKSIVIWEYDDSNYYSFNIIRDSYKKLQYLVTCCADSKKKLNNIARAVKEFTGYPLKIAAEKRTYGIDPMLPKALTQKTILEFLFSKSSFIITGNDNTSRVNQPNLIDYQKETAKYKLTTEIFPNKPIWLISNEHVNKEKNEAQVDLNLAFHHIVSELENESFDFCYHGDNVTYLENNIENEWDITTPFPEGEGIIYATKRWFDKTKNDPNDITKIKFKLEKL